MQHSILGASGADRWMACPGSVRLSAEVPEDLRSAGSSYAREGTAAHGLAAHVLRSDDWDVSRFVGGVVEAEAEVVWPPDPEFPSRLPEADEDHVFEITDDMADAVQVYVDEVADQIQRLGPATLVMVERGVRPFADRGDMFGTSDCILVQPFGEMVVLDYKHGRGVAVDASHNRQEMYYGFSAMREVGGAGNVEKVTLVVVQPRAPHVDGPIRRFEISSDELAAFGATLRAAAEATENPKAALISGDHCRWCPAKVVCPELRSRVQAEVSCAFDEPVDLPESLRPSLPNPRDPVQISRALMVKPLIEDWVKTVDVLALRAAEQGLDIPGFKVVERRTNRRWKDAELVAKEAAEALRARGKDPAAIYSEPKLKSPKQLESIKTLGKEWVAARAEKPPGGRTLAPATDRREGKAFARVEFPDDLPQLEAGEIDSKDWEP